MAGRRDEITFCRRMIMMLALPLGAQHQPARQVLPSARHLGPLKEFADGLISLITLAVRQSQTRLRVG